MTISKGYNNFTIDMLVNMLARIGKTVKMRAA